jgi:hypothetical protein
MVAGGCGGNRDLPVGKTLMTMNALKMLASFTNEGIFYGDFFDRM